MLKIIENRLKEKGCGELISKTGLAKLLGYQKRVIEKAVASGSLKANGYLIMRNDAAAWLAKNSKYAENIFSASSTEITPEQIEYCTQLAKRNALIVSRLSMAREDLLQELLVGIIKADTSVITWQEAVRNTLVKILRKARQQIKTISLEETVYLDNSNNRPVLLKDIIPNER